LREVQAALTNRIEPFLEINRLSFRVLNCASLHLDYLYDRRKSHVKSPMFSGVSQALKPETTETFYITATGKTKTHERVL